MCRFHMPFSYYCSVCGIVFWAVSDCTRNWRDQTMCFFLWSGQFDDTDPKERVKKGSFFNWFYFSIDIGALVAGSLIVWIQEKIGWGLGFGISALFMGTAIANFFLGTTLYRFQKPGGSPLTRACQVLVASFHKWNLEVPTDSSLLYETPDKTSAIQGSRKLDNTDDLKCLDKAAVIPDAENQDATIFTKTLRVAIFTGLIMSLTKWLLLKLLTWKNREYIALIMSPLYNLFALSLTRTAYLCFSLGQSFILLSRVNLCFRRFLFPVKLPVSV